MPTLCIRYEINPNRLSDFEAYARNWPKPIERCGGKLIGYFLPTKLAGRTDSAIALIDFPSLAAYEEYRGRLMDDPEVKQNVAQAERSGCILLEDRSFMKWVGGEML
jgi:NIPSNAP protein